VKKSEAKALQMQLKGIIKSFEFLYKFSLKNKRNHELIAKVLSHLMDANDYIEELLTKTKEENI